MGYASLLNFCSNSSNEAIADISSSSSSLSSLLQSLQLESFVKIVSQLPARKLEGPTS